MKRIAILGAGGMGTALALLFDRGGVGVSLWCREPARARGIAASRENARHLPGVMLPPSITIESDCAAALERAELVVAAIPTSYLRTILVGLARDIPAGLPFLSVVKGIENETFRRPSEILVEVLGDRPVSILSGPSHAEELARGLPASVVVAGNDDPLNVRIRDALNKGPFRVYTNPDAVGVELAGALKNVIGVAAGVADGLACGDNAKAALLTRGLAEISRFATELGALPTTFFGLAGIGDLITTCYSPFGRNRAVGVRIGRGESLETILGSMVNVAEGVPTTRSVHELAARRGVRMPITSELYQILFEGKSALQAMTDLFDRLPREEL